MAPTWEVDPRALARSMLLLANAPPLLERLRYTPRETPSLFWFYPPSLPRVPTPLPFCPSVSPQHPPARPRSLQPLLPRFSSPSLD